MKASVIIPTKNGGRLFERVLAAVLEQKTPWPFEMIVIDSGSCDGTADICRKSGVTLIEIPEASFGHGRTRNQAIGEAQGEFVAVITQDALPCSPDWLNELVAATEQEPHIAGAFGAHRPYPECDPYTARDLDQHFLNIEASGHLFKLDDPERYRVDAGYRQFLHFFSNNNACLRRSVWEKIPYPDVDFAEDQAWAKRIIEAGYAKAYAPKAAVYHSHTYGVLDILRRSYDESRALHGLFGYNLCPTIQHGLKHGTHMTIADCLWSLRHGRWFKDLFWMLRSGWANGARLTGYYLGTHDSYLSPAVRGLLSLDRSRKTQTSVWQGLRALVGHHLGRQKAPWRDPLAPFAFLSDDPIEALRPAVPEDEKTLNWVIPDFGIGAGGHTNIFRFISLLERMGFVCRIYIVGETRRASGEAARNAIRQHFAPVEGDVHLGMAFAPAAFTIATSWETAYWVDRFRGSTRKCYFVQDFEPYFFPAGTQYFLAENTYRLGFTGITAGRWLASKLDADFAMTTHDVGFSFDRAVYSPRPNRHPGTRRVFFYARPVTERRAFELGLLVLKRLSTMLENVEFVLAGWDLSHDAIPFPCVSMGVVEPKALGEVFNTCDAALVISATNLSLMPLELMACECAVVSNKGPNVEWLLTQDVAVLCDSTLHALAQGLFDILRDDERRSALIQRARQFAETTSWETEAERMASIFRAMGAQAPAPAKACPPQKGNARSFFSFSGHHS